MEAFGPVPSRRLGQSLGINNVPAKTCSYGCVYCQVGRTNLMQIRRQFLYEPEEVFDVVQDKVKKTLAAGERIDYLSFVPDGEATLDVNLGREIDMLRVLKIDIAVITNGSIIDDPDVQHELARADLVSLKVDAVREGAWRRVDRPHGRLDLDSILEGMLTFSKMYDGRLMTETLLVHGTNDGEDNVTATADFIAKLRPEVAYISIPTRPPSEDWVRPPDEDVINRAYQIFVDRIENVECLLGMESGSFGYTGNVEQDILGVTAVHPMHETAVRELLARANA
ncbi:MAG: radical SAM protein, partial [Candidatus Krumholzibacteria bacterium]|nr:radical SAM protein [Candidatus Krumholzibacteria bacterium]